MAALHGQNLITFEPLVYIEGEMYTILEANELCKRLDDEQFKDGKGKEVSQMIRIDYFYAQALKIFKCDVSLGIGGRGLTDMLPDAAVQDRFPEFIPYLKSHCLLSILEKQAADKLREISLTGIANGLNREYWQAINQYVYEARTALNKDYQLLETVPIPMKEDYRERFHPTYSAELSEEENYNQIDGVLNNVPGQTVQEKTSILEKLRQFQQLITDNERLEKEYYTMLGAK